ncbi:MAG: acetoin utilization protein AcuC [Coriobacteriia bacterium]|nr:acetoin utilization protein AcuC [Coriobacteriia bacterium]
MQIALVYDSRLSRYDLGPHHPLRPERVSRSVELMSAFGLLNTAIRTIPSRLALDEELQLFHTPGYVRAVRDADTAERSMLLAHGLGTADNPVFPGVHEAAALVAGAGIVAMREVLDGVTPRSFSIAGGLHHAHANRAAGFCVYNDVAVAIADALSRNLRLRIAYIDIDAHHGDGVQEAFYAEPRVLTVSIHESGRSLFPGTGFPDERGDGDALGTSVNVPLPPEATDACYRLVFNTVIEPAVQAFAPDLIVLQAGFDTHHADPLTSLGMTLPGYHWLTQSIVTLADDLCGGRTVAFGGGGYSWEHIVPRAWSMLAAMLAGVSLPPSLPPAWLSAQVSAGIDVPHLLDEDEWVPPRDEDVLLGLTERAIHEVHSGPPFR